MSRQSFYLPGDIRDNQDARDAAERHFSQRKQAQTGSRWSKMGAADNCPPNHGRGGGTQGQPPGGRRGDPACDVPSECRGDVLGFNTLADANWPVAGGAGVSAPTPGVVVGSGNAQAFKPRSIFFEARDAAGGYAVVPALLTSAVVSGSEQLVSAGAATGITSAVFALTNTPLPVAWQGFTDTGQHQLTMLFGNFLAAGVTIEIFGVLWGDRIGRS